VDRSRRRDAVETRERILRVATADWAGPRSFDEIACRAGVSRATVYRHFPDRHALGAAITARAFRALRAALAEPMPFRDVLHTVLTTAVSLRWLGELIDALPERERARHLRLLVDLLTPAFRRAQTAGELRPDVRPTDLAPLLRALLAAAREPDGEATAQRLLTVLMDGMFGPGGPATGCVWTTATHR
jgi:AcrR family transcriptional regulator